MATVDDLQRWPYRIDMPPGLLDDALRALEHGDADHWADRSRRVLIDALRRAEAEGPGYPPPSERAA